MISLKNFNVQVKLLCAGNKVTRNYWLLIADRPLPPSSYTPGQTFKTPVDFMLILDPESTFKWHYNKKLNSHSGCQNEQQVDFEVQLETKITIAGH